MKPTIFFLTVLMAVSLFFESAKTDNKNINLDKPVADCEYVFESSDDYYNFIKNDTRLDRYRDGDGAINVYELNTGNDIKLINIRTVSYGSYFTYKYMNNDGDILYFTWQPTKDAEKYLQNGFDSDQISPSEKDDFYHTTVLIDDARYFQLEWIAYEQYFIAQVPDNGNEDELKRPDVKRVLIKK